jgi:hypothetical protein
MEKVTGIKSVDFKITALGHGVVNWNGPTLLKVQEDSELGKLNHTMPKLRGYTNLTGKENDKGFKYLKKPTEIDFKDTPLYISQNCIRHHLFRDQSFDLHEAKDKNLQLVLSSITGLVRGYVVAASQCKRTSPLLMEDFVEQWGNCNYEQFTQAGKTDATGKRDETSFFSKTTFGDTKYTSYGSISIEQLQFISLDKKFDRCAMVIKEKQGEEVAQAVQAYIQTLNADLKPEATFHQNYVRGGTIFEEGENGILLNNDAVQALIEHTLQMISELSIRQAKAYMYVDEILVDYNDSHKMMRIKHSEDDISEQATSDYATYFYAK